MILLTVEHVSKAYPEQRVLEDVSFGIHSGDRIGIIGANGSGKTTLLGIIAGLVHPDQGQIVTGNDVRVAYLEQDPKIDPATRLQEIADRGRDTLALLDRLGFEDLDVPIGSLSGGERRRAALAAALAVEAEVLVLDEPTNHLDVDVIDWLEDRLAGRSGALVLVTHDRYVLDRVCNRVMEVRDGSVFSHHGSYEDFLEARQRRDAHLEATERKRQNRARTELAWLRRNPKARTGKAKYRVGRAEALQDHEVVGGAGEVEFELPTRRLGSKIINLHNVGKRFDERWIVAGVTMRLSERARIGLVGPNGSGKTTLLRLLAGTLPPDTGKVSFGTTVVVGMYGQEPAPLPPEQRLLHAMEDVTLHTKLDSGISVSASQLLERFMFPPSQHSVRIDELSGGERRRLELLRVLASAPNVLLLDEPTNDLDLDTLRALEEFLDTWQGSLVTASHDRYFLDRVVSDLYSLQPDGTVLHHPGGWSAFRSSTAKASAEKEGRSDRQATPGTKPVSRADRLSFHEQRELRSLGDRIPMLERRVAEQRAALASPSQDWEKVSEISQALDEALSQLAEAEDRWLDLSTRHEGNQSRSS